MPACTLFSNVKKGHIFIENKPLIEIGEQLSQISGYPANIPKAPPKRSINRFLAPQTLKNGTYGIFGRNFPEHFWALSGPKGLLGVWGPFYGAPFAERHSCRLAIRRLLRLLTRERDARDYELWRNLGPDLGKHITCLLTWS